MDEIKIGSQEELDMHERLERLRIASAERKWKTELNLKATNDRRAAWHEHCNRNDGITFAIYGSIFGFTATICICLLRVAFCLIH
jgi:hypothetical protein